MDHKAERSPSVSLKRAWSITIVLGLLYIFSFADRFVLALLVAPVKAQFGVSDLAVSLLYGPAFAIFYAVLGFPAGRLADKSNRRKIIVAGVAIWSVCTIASGLVSEYWMLVVLRSGLAIGEAALTPAAYSMIADMFPPEKRRRATSIYMAMGSIGSSGSFILGAAILSFTGSGVEDQIFGVRAWQAPFIALGVPTLAIGILFFLMSEEPARLSKEARPALREALDHLRQRSMLYFGIFIGGSLAGTIYLSAKTWSAEILRRNFDVTITQAGYGIGTTTLIASFVGSITLPIFTEKLENAGRSDATLLVSIGGVIGAMACTAGLLFASSWIVYLLLLGGICLLGFGASANILVALQRIAPDRLRGVLIALALAMQMLVGLGLGPPVVAIVSQRLSAAGDKLPEALAITAMCEGLIALGLFLYCRRLWVAAQANASG